MWTLPFEALIILTILGVALSIASLLIISENVPIAICYFGMLDVKVDWEKKSLAITSDVATPLVIYYVNCSGDTVSISRVVLSLSPYATYNTTFNEVFMIVIVTLYNVTVEYNKASRWYEECPVLKHKTLVFSICGVNSSEICTPYVKVKFSDDSIEWESSIPEGLVRKCVGQTIMFAWLKGLVRVVTNTTVPWATR